MELMIKILAFAHHATSHGFIDDFWTLPAWSKEYFSQGYSYFELVDTFNCSSMLPLPGCSCWCQPPPSECFLASCRGSSLARAENTALIQQDKGSPGFHRGSEGRAVWHLENYALEFSCLASLRSQAVCRQWGTGKRTTM